MGIKLNPTGFGGGSGSGGGGIFGGIGNFLSDFDFGKVGDFLGSDTFLGGENQKGLLGTGADLFGALSQYKLGQDQLGLQEDAFDFNKDLSNRNLSNQGRLVNENIENRRIAELYGSGAFSGQDNTQQLRDEDVARHVSRFGADTSAIG